MAKRHVSSVEGNVKCGVKCALGPKTLLVGRNRSGKSAVINTIELALTGRVSDLAGRAEVAKDNELISLAAGGADQLHAVVGLSSGETAIWETGRKGKTVKRADHSLPPDVDAARVFPARGVADAVTASPDAARRYFLQLVVGDLTDEDILARIPAPLHERYTSTLAALRPSATPLERLLHALEVASDKVTETQGQIRATTKVIETSSEGLQPKPTEIVIHDAENDVADAKKAVEAAAKAAGSERASVQAKQQLGALEAQLEEAKQKLAEVTSAYESSKQHREAIVAQATGVKPPEPLTPAQRALPVLLKRQLEIKKEVCTVCGSHVALPVFQARLDAVTKMFSDRAAAESRFQQLDAQFRAAAEEERQNGQQREWAASNLNSMEQAVARARKALEPAAPNDPDDADLFGDPAEEAVQAAEEQMSLEDARSWQSNAERALRDLELVSESWRAVERARENQVNLEQDLAGWKQLKESCNDTIGKLLDTRVADLEEKVNKRLPPTDRFVVQLRDGAREVFKLGLKRPDGRIDTALCGAEWVRVLTALSDAVAPADGLSVLVMDDRDWHPDELAATLTALGAAESQVIVQATKEPTTVPPGWLVIHTELGEHRMLPGPTPVVEGAVAPDPVGVELESAGTKPAPKSRSKARKAAAQTHIQFIKDT